MTLEFIYRGKEEAFFFPEIINSGVIQNGKPKIAQINLNKESLLDKQEIQADPLNNRDHNSTDHYSLNYLLLKTRYSENLNDKIE